MLAPFTHLQSLKALPAVLKAKAAVKVGDIAFTAARVTWDQSYSVEQGTTHVQQILGGTVTQLLLGPLFGPAVGETVYKVTFAAMDTLT